MFHPDTQVLIDYWAALSRRAEARAGLPDRAALEPEALGTLLPRAFLAELRREDSLLRLAGEWIEAFHGEPLKGRPLLSLWRAASGSLVSGAIAQSVREGRPVVIVAAAGVAAVTIEIVVAPLRGPTGRADRLLGLYAPTATLSLAEGDSRLLTARVAVGVGAAARPPLSLAAVHGRRTA